MLPDSFFENLEQIHRDYYTLRYAIEYRIGVKVMNFINSIKKGKFLDFVRMEYIYRKKGRYAVYVEPSDYKYGNYPPPEVKIAVYSCIAGGYDDILEPFFNIDNVDYIMFTDKNIMCEKWDVRPIPQEIAKLKDSTLINRYIKFHPAVVGEGYDYALYVDGNICIVSNVRNMVNAINPKTGLALHRHNSRDCIYSEMKVCKYIRKGNPEKMQEQVKRYKDEGFPPHYGLLEAPVILSNLHNQKSAEILDKWWNEFVNSESKRDQIALPYVLWKNDIPTSSIGNLGNNVNQNPKFRKYLHIERE